MEKIPISLLEPSPLNTSLLSLFFDLPSSKYFKINLDYSLSDLEYVLNAYMQFMAPLSHPFDAQKTLQLPNSSVGKLDNFMVSYIVSLVKLVIMSLFSVISWFSISLAIGWLLLHTFGYDITFIRSNFRSLWSPNLPNCQCRLVAPSFPTVTQPDFGATIPWLFVAPYDLISDISEPNKLYYRIRKVSH